jgi:hypothetical protein
VANPIVPVESTDAIGEQLKVDLSVPEDLSIEKCSVIDNTLGEVIFTLGGQQYSYRGMSTPEQEDISGLYYEFSSHTDAEIEGQPCLLELSDGGAGTCRWYDSDEGITYSVSVGAGASLDKLLEAAALLIATQAAQD